MVSGFLISPYDQDRIFSGLAIEILIWSNTCAGTCGLKRFMISWFIVFSSTPLEQSAPRVVKFPPLFPPHRGRVQGAGHIAAPSRTALRSDLPRKRGR